MKSTQAMRDRIRELMSREQDDYDRAVECVLDDLEHMLGAAQSAGIQPSAEQIEAIAKDYAQRWYGDDFALMDDGDKADLRIEAQHWLKCWFALAAQPPAAPVAYLHRVKDSELPPELSFEPARNPQWTSEPLYSAPPADPIKTDIQAALGDDYKLYSRRKLEEENARLRAELSRSSAENATEQEGVTLQICFDKVVKDRDHLREVLSEAHGALVAFKDAVIASDVMKGREYVGLGIQVNDAIDKARMVLSSEASR